MKSCTPGLPRGTSGCRDIGPGVADDTSGWPDITSCRHASGWPGWSRAGNIGAEITFSSRGTGADAWSSLVWHAFVRWSESGAPSPRDHFSIAKEFSGELGGCVEREPYGGIGALRHITGRVCSAHLGADPA